MCSHKPHLFALVPFPSLYNPFPASSSAVPSLPSLFHNHVLSLLLNKENVSSLGAAENKLPCVTRNPVISYALNYIPDVDAGECFYRKAHVSQTKHP